METEHKSNYILSSSLFYHHKAVRTVDLKGDILISGSIDKTCQIYHRENGFFTHKFTIDIFDDYILSVLISEDLSFFFVACKDAKIYIIDMEGNPISLLEGHTGAVNSLSQYGGHLVSGSWDTTARIWDLKTKTCTKILPGHSHAVCVLFLNEFLILTASEDKNINFWENGEKVRTIKSAHTQIIRELTKVDEIGFLSCSNDESIKLWSLNGDILSTFQEHSSYVYSIKLINLHKYVSCSEDRSFKIWENSSCIQTVMHPNNIWSLCVDHKNNDIITACADGGIRFFTADHSRIASESDLKDFETSCQKAAQQTENQGLSESELQKLPLVENSKNHIGKQDGEIRLFRNNGAAEAYLWKANEKIWEKIGDVISGNSRKMYEGDRYFEQGEYDYVFDVDYDGVPRKLPYNEGDNQLETAEKFLAREGLNKGYIDEITSFIRKNSRGTVPKEKEIKKDKLPENFKYFPINTYIKFETMNLQGLTKKVLEFSQTLSDQKNKSFNEKEVKYFHNIIDILSKDTQYHTSTIATFEIDLIQKLLKWPIDYMIPIYDLLRVFLLHSQSEVLFSGLGAGLPLLTDICQVLQGSSNEILITLCLKVLCNMFCHISNQNSMLKNCLVIFDSMKKLSAKEKINNNVLNALSSLIFNYSIALALNFAIEDRNFEDFVYIVEKRIEREENNGNKLKIFVAVGNILISKRKSYIDIIENKIKNKLNFLQIKGNGDEEQKKAEECLKDIQLLLK